MASNQFWATSCSNTSYNGLLNGGEINFERTATTSQQNKQLGKFYFDTTGTIPRIATINKIHFGHQLRMNRKATALYKTISKTRLYVNGTSKSSEQSSSAVGDTWIGFSWENSSSIDSKALYDGGAYQTVNVTYQGLLKTTQYIKGLNIVIDWSAISATAVSIGSNRTMYIGDTVTLSPIYTPSEISYPGVTYTSSNTSVATISSSGVVTAVAKGTTTITATTTDGSNKSASITITVKKAVTGVSLNKSSITLNEGGIETLTATVTPSDASVTTVSWSSSNTSVATVNSSGKITAVSKGSCTITCTSTDDSSKKATCSVTVLRPVTGMYVSTNSVTLDTGKTSSITVHVVPETASNTNFSITSSNSSVATMTSAGIISGIGKGTANITVTSADGGFSQTIAVTVLKRVTGISISPTTIDFTSQGASQNVTVSITPSDASNTNYTLAFDDGASGLSLSNNTVTATSATGKGTLRAVAADGGFEATCEIRILRSENLFIKENNQWKYCYKIYKKINGSWVEQTNLSSALDPNANYWKRN